MKQMTFIRSALAVALFRSATTALATAFLLGPAIIDTTVSELQAKDKAKADTSKKSDFVVTTRHDDTQVQFLTDKGTTLLDITSPRGISTATIKRTKNIWPKAVSVRLHLRGLESFKVDNQKVTVEWSVSSTGKNARHVTLREGKKTQKIKAKSPYFSLVRIVGGNGKIPLDGGYFEVPLPVKLFDGNPQQITLQWVDFFRN